MASALLMDGHVFDFGQIQVLFLLHIALTSTFHVCISNGHFKVLPNGALKDAGAAKCRTMMNPM